MIRMGAFGTLAFLCIFHLIGGLVVGSAIRKLRQGFSLLHIFLIVWGIGFGLAPVAMGWQIFQSFEMPYLVVSQVAVFIGAVAIAAFLSEEYLSAFKSKNVITIGTGGLFLLIGAGAGAILVRNGEGVGWIFLLTFGGAGGLVLSFGLRELLREK